MLLVSRHLTEYNLVPEKAVVRINMAWEHSLNQLRIHLENLQNDIFLDIPRNRKKPPSFIYSMPEILDVCAHYESIKYLGISNVEYPEDFESWQFKSPARVNIVPKIETAVAIDNIVNITDALKPPKYVMLDHDDLFTDLYNSNNNWKNMYEDFINPFLEVCHDLHVQVLRTAGIVFSDC